MLYSDHDTLEAARKLARANSKRSSSIWEVRQNPDTARFEVYSWAAMNPTDRTVAVFKDGLDVTKQKPKR